MTLASAESPQALISTPMTSARNRTSVVAIGAGPSNLSLAALAHPLPDIDVTLVERKAELNWHAGLLVDGALMQTNALKDLVTPVNPTSEYSFLAYLKDKRRLYRAIVRGIDRVTRVEFEDYLRWAMAKLPHVHLGEQAEVIRIDDDALIVETPRHRFRTGAVVLGVGRSPAIPPCARFRLGQNVFHSTKFLAVPRDFAGRRVTVVGGGQSGAEVFHELLKGTRGATASLRWVSRRANFFALEDSSFVNEWFFPQHSLWFNGQPLPIRRRTLEAQNLASDGISSATIRSIYELLYARDIDGRNAGEEVDIRVNTSLEAIRPDAQGQRLLFRDCLTGGRWEAGADVVILCTGYQFALPAFLEGLRPRLSFADAGNGRTELALRDDFSVEWDGPPQCKLYVQNGALTQHGIADPNLSLIAWRSGKVLNAILGRPVFDCGPVDGVLTWPENGVRAERHIARA
jgi:lysine N6-hydroxylase